MFLFGGINMYGGSGQDRRKNQNNAQNYGRRRTDYEEEYNKMRQQRDGYANNQGNSNYHQSNLGYGDDSYYDGQNNKNSTFQYTQYGNNEYGNINNQLKDREYNSSLNFTNGSNNVQYSEGMYNNYDQYSNTDYRETNYSNTSYNNTSYGYGNNYNNGVREDNNYSDYYTQTESYTNINSSNQYDGGYNTGYSQYNNDYARTQYDDISKDNNYSSNTKCDISVLQPAKSHPIMSIIFRACLLFL